MDQRVRRQRPRPAVIQTEGTIIVRSTAMPAPGTEEEVKEIVVAQFQTEPAYVRINAGVTKNLGNYESFRCDVSITMPCYPEEVQEMTQKVSNEVARLLDEELQKYQIEG